MTPYFPHSICTRIERETDSEFDSLLFRDDPDMDIDARACRDEELFLDLTGNLDSFTVEVKEDDRSDA